MVMVAFDESMAKAQKSKGLENNNCFVEKHLHVMFERNQGVFVLFVPSRFRVDSIDPEVVASSGETVQYGQGFP